MQGVQVKRYVTEYHVHANLCAGRPANTQRRLHSGSSSETIFLLDTDLFVRTFFLAIDNLGQYLHP